MKKFIAFLVVAFALLACLSPRASVVETENGTQVMTVCSDLEPRPNPYDNVVI